MASKINILINSATRTRPVSCTSTIPATLPATVSFRTLPSCKLGISRYPNFDYNAQGGTGTGTATITSSNSTNVSVEFDLETLYIPPLTTETTRFLGLPLPPGLRIDIVPKSFGGRIAQDSGKVELEFVANFCFSVGRSLYEAPPLLVKTVLTTEESKGTVRSGKGERMDGEGECRLVGVAIVDRIDDWFMNTFLGLPTECLAVLNAVVSVSDS
ncbi:hypothetical protein LINPERPRIM_LOCUS12809 [Linum perenne]